MRGIDPLGMEIVVELTVGVAVDVPRDQVVVALLDGDGVREVERDVAVRGAAGDLGYAAAVAVHGRQQGVEEEGFVFALVTEVLVRRGHVDEVELQILELITARPQG